MFSETTQPIILNYFFNERVIRGKALKHSCICLTSFHKILKDKI